MSWLSSIFTGSNPTLSGDINKLGQTGGFATGIGQQDTTAASGFWNSILSGDSSKVSQVLAPEISAAKTSAQQQNKTAAENGTRSGGTAASTAATNDKVHSDITNLTGNLTGAAASNLGSIGSNMLSTGLSAYGQQAQASQAQAQNWSNSLFGKAIGGVTGALTGKGLTSLLGGFGGGGGSASNSYQNLDIAQGIAQGGSIPNPSGFSNLTNMLS